MDAMELARYIVTKCTKDDRPISNFQLQWMLYHIKMAFLKEAKVIFFDSVEMWKCGPVIPNVYYHFCGFGAMPIRWVYPEAGQPELSVRSTIDAIQWKAAPMDIGKIDYTHAMFRKQSFLPQLFPFAG